MGRKFLFSFSLIFLCMGFSLTLNQIFARKNVSYQTSSNKEVVVKSDQQNNGDMKPIQNFTIPITQIQGFAINGGQFAKAQDCASSFSPAIPIGLAMSPILLLVLAYALHMLIYLRDLDRHYDPITSPAHFPQLKARDAAEEKELLRSLGVERYELRTQQICKMYV